MGDGNVTGKGSGWRRELLGTPTILSLAQADRFRKLNDFQGEMKAYGLYEHSTLEVLSAGNGTGASSASTVLAEIECG